MQKLLSTRIPVSPETSDNLCGELAKNQTREFSQTLMKHED